MIPDALLITSKHRSFSTFSIFLLVFGSMTFITHAVYRFLALVAPAKLSFLSDRTLLDSTKNHGTGDSPTNCFWTQLLRVSCLDPVLGFYPLLLNIMWVNNQLVYSLHFWHSKISHSCQTGRFWIILIVQR